MPEELYLADLCFLIDRRKPMSILDLMHFFVSDPVLKKTTFFIRQNVPLKPLWEIRESVN